MSILPRTEHQHDKICTDCRDFSQIALGPTQTIATGICSCPNSDHYGHSIAGFHPGCLSFAEEYTEE